MDGELRVDPDLLRSRAAELDTSARALADGTAAVPGLTVPAPGWVSADALATLDGAVASALNAVAVRVAHAGDLLREAAAGYEEADRRAATRLGRVG